MKSAVAGLCKLRRTAEQSLHRYIQKQCQYPNTSRHASTPIRCKYVHNAHAFRHKQQAEATLLQTLHIPAPITACTVQRHHERYRRYCMWASDLASTSNEAPIKGSVWAEAHPGTSHVERIPGDGQLWHPAGRDGGHPLLLNLVPIFTATALPMGVSSAWRSQAICGEEKRAGIHI